MKEPVTVSLEKELIETIDRHRGLIPRSRFVSRAVEDYLKNENLEAGR
ncbi:MAG: hypothetical protein ABSB53_03690 [Nitrososphaerales archaeon]|jgi:metal-responsive CopG/Arc/MetJ family transcriptional regulator